jgi:Cof subfamily protein (haloacid dehalogenase superfamily)
MHIFLDLDGTIIDHDSNSIPESTYKAILMLKENGHQVYIATGRVPALFYGVEKELGIDSYIAGNGNVGVIDHKVVYVNAIPLETIKLFIDTFSPKYDIGFEGSNEYVLFSDNHDVHKKFNDSWHIPHPKKDEHFHLNNPVIQLLLYTEEDSYKDYKHLFPELNFSYSNKYGLDINLVGGLKENGIKVFEKELGFSSQDVIAVGDGINDIGMIEYAGIGIAMGNAYEETKAAADMVTDTVQNDGLYKAFRKLKLI